MAASNIIFQFASGRTATAYVAASAAAGAYLPLSKLDMATANSPDEIKFDDNDVITDVFFSAATGAVELIKNDNQTGRMLFAQTNQASNAGRQKHNIGIIGGASYRFRVVSAFPA